MSSSKLRQLELAYNPLHDRLLLKLHMQDLTQFHMWLTRRFTRLLWPILQKLLLSEEKSEVEQREENQRIEQAFHKEQAMRAAGAQAEAPKRFGTTISKQPFGTEPILLSRIEIKPAEGVLGILCLYPEQGPGFEIGIDSVITKSLCRLIVEVSQKAEWDLGYQF